jgi:hypothetical protein
VLLDPRRDRVAVVDREVQGDRGASFAVGCLDVDLRVLVGHHPAGAADRQLAVADAPVGHHDRLEDDLGAQGRDVPLDGTSAVRHTEVRRQLSHLPLPLRSAA